ncbi:hypothetical protein P154DRAFT_547692 [Amniculicola lignicola CBS 123094]|uniref:Uncharacterized protein n=1 Tax=Amniculicola lignicola CBS 123094 TaxID=1392246 RepID=A0A6A5W7S2_9PLEO|nr:hypothetical protein P154DRAFT_547692 [Amniculicola lignicola CBS 123094]
MEQSTLIRRGIGLRGVDPDKVPGTVKLIENHGQEVHEWKLPYRPGRHARILANGNLAYNGVHPDAPRLFPLWRKYRGGLMQQIILMGRLFLNIILTVVEGVEVEKGSSILGGISGAEAPNEQVYADCIKHVSVLGELLWSWKAIGHLDPKQFKLQPHYPREHWLLVNSVYPLKDRNILASLRSISAVVTISCELDDGSILTFDNGTFRHHESATYSRVIQVSREDKSVAAFGRIFEVTEKKDLVWEYINPDFADYSGLDANEIESYFDYPANALLRAYKHTPEQIPWPHPN